MWYNQVLLLPAVYSNSAGVVRTAAAAVVAESECGGHLRHRDSHAFPLLPPSPLAAPPRILLTSKPATLLPR